MKNLKTFLILTTASLLSHRALAADIVAVDCNGDICVGSSVKDDHYNIGVVVSLNSAGKAEVRFDTWSNTYVKNIADLSPQVQCLDNGLCEGNDYLDQNGFVTGTVTSVYADGHYQVRYETYSGLHWK